MEKVSIVIPVHNIIKRGFKRVLNSVNSLQEQMDCIAEIIVVDSSEKRQFEMLGGLLEKTHAIHVHVPGITIMNKPILLNKGISMATGKYIMCTDADYLFKKDFLRECEKQRGEKKIIFKEVKMLPPISNISKDGIKAWRFPKAPFNQWKKLANGACQYASKEFFLKFPYDERMDGFGAMDNLTAYVAFNNGLEIVWMTASEILHQHHPIEKKMSGTMKKRFDRNQEILSNYRKMNKLPQLLK